MLRKTSVSMMVLLVASSLIGISSIQQYVEGQPRVTKLPQLLSGAGTLAVVRLIDSPAGKVCAAALDFTASAAAGGLPPGTTIDLVAPNEHWCTIFLLSKLISKGGIAFEAQNIKVTSLSPAIQRALSLSPNDPVYRITYLDIV